MRVQLSGKEYLIDWMHAQYPRPESLLLENGKEMQVRGNTTCIIQPAEGMTPPEVTPSAMVVGIAWCAAADVFEKEKGRKVSLARALEESGMPREDRTIIWREYHGRS